MYTNTVADWYPPDVDKRSYTFSSSSDELPTDPLLMPSIGNGHVGAVIYWDRLFMNGLYNGVMSNSHRAAIPALNRIKVRNIPKATSVYSLDCIKGIFTHTQNNDTLNVQHLACAHRTIPSLLINQVTIQRVPGSASGTEATIDIKVGTDFVSPDVKLETISENETAVGMKGAIKETEVPGDTKVQIKTFYIYMDRPPTELTLPADIDSVTFTYIMSVNSWQQQCLYQYDKGCGLVTGNEILSQHYQGWARIWQQGRIDIWCDEISNSQVVYGCQYYLLSSLPAQYDSDCTVDEFYGLSPESLAYGDGTGEDYLGHVFWDQETWMYPPILLLHTDIANHIMSSRLRVVKQAEANAAKNLVKGAQFSWEQGVTGIHLGARCYRYSLGSRVLQVFTWEQGVTGVPISPSDDCEKYELHVSADIALAIRHYCYVTGTVPDALASLSSELADYWISRLTWLEDKQKYGVLGVMPPDEWHYPVNNSAYTNMAAKLAITLPAELSFLSSKSRDLTAKDQVIDVDVYVPFDKELNYHPEFDGYKVTDPKTSEVKQADVVLIGYPLAAEPNRAVREKDLDFYESVTSLNGPAMTWSMFCVGRMELDQPTKAAVMYRRQLLQATQPFQVWSEYPGGKGAINFITGMGGFLQSLLNGYVGIRIQATGITLKPALPPATSRLKVTGLSYHGAKFNVDIRSDGYRVVQTGCNTSLYPFYLSSSTERSMYPLYTNIPVSLPHSLSTIQICNNSVPSQYWSYLCVLLIVLVVCVRWYWQC